MATEPAASAPALPADARRSGGGDLSAARLLAYGALALPLAALNLPLYLVLPAFYASDLGVGLAAVGSALLAARVFDAVIDPFVGDWSDRVRARFPRKLWVVLASPLLVVATWQLFVPPEGAGALHLLVWTCAAYLAWTAVILPYQAMGAEIVDDAHERTRVAGAREAFVLVGILLAAAAPAIVPLFGRSGNGATLLGLALGMSLLLPLCLALLWTVPERPIAAPPAGPSLVRGIRLLAQDRPFVRLVAAFLLNGLANGLPATLFLLFVQHVLGAPESGGPLLVLYFLAGIVAVPAWVALSRRIGKHRAWAASMLLACVTFAAVPFLGAGDVVAFGAICVLSGLSLGADLALPASIQADIVDRDRQRVGRWRSGLFFAAWSMASKLALALAAGIALPILEWGGFDATGSNDAATLMLLSGLYAGLPVALKLAATALVWRFPQVATS